MRFIIILLVATILTGCDYDYNEEKVEAKTYYNSTPSHDKWVEYREKYNKPINQPQKTMKDLEPIFYNLFDNFTPVSDQDKYGVQDTWDLIGDDGEGDCEDFALTLMERLLASGFDKANVRLALGSIDVSNTKIYHCVCLVEIDSGVLYVCDNNQGIVVFNEYKCTWDKMLDETHEYWVKMEE